MMRVATSLKIPESLKRRLVRLAKQSGESPHALMLRALEHHAEAAEQHARFVRDAEEADAEMERTGKGYAMADVHRYFLDRARGKPVRRPQAVRWRK